MHSSDAKHTTSTTNLHEQLELNQGNCHGKAESFLIYANKNQTLESFPGASLAMKTTLIHSPLECTIWILINHNSLVLTPITDCVLSTQFFHRLLACANNKWNTEVCSWGQPGTEITLTHSCPESLAMCDQPYLFTTLPNHRQPAVDTVLSSQVKGISAEVKRRGLEGAVEGIGHIHEQHIPEIQTEQDGDQWALCMYPWQKQTQKTKQLYITPENWHEQTAHSMMLYVHKDYALFRARSPGRPLRLSHSSWPLQTDTSD